MGKTICEFKVTLFPSKKRGFGVSNFRQGGRGKFARRGAGRGGEGGSLHVHELTRYHGSLVMKMIGQNSIQRKSIQLKTKKAALHAQTGSVLS